VDAQAAKDIQGTADFLHKVEVLPSVFDTRKVIDTSFSTALNP